MQAGFTPAVTYASAPQASHVRQPFQTIRSRGRWAGPRKRPNCRWKWHHRDRPL